MPEELTFELTPPPEEGVPLHRHLGTDQPKVSLKNLDGLIEVVDTVPTSQPNSIYNQIKLYVSGTQSSICVYDYSGTSWKCIGNVTTVSDHGALSGLTDDDHTQYALRTIMTADGDIIYRASGVWTRLAKGTSSQVLIMNSGATAPEWSSAIITPNVWDAGDVLRQSADSIRQHTGDTTPTKVKEIKMVASGTLRIKFDLKINDQVTAYGQIYKNGVAIGTQQNAGTTWTTKSEDIGGWANDDSIQLYLWPDPDFRIAYARNFRIYADVKNDFTVLND